MRIGVISDIHANKIAFDAVLAAMPPVDQIVCAGDVVGYNPWPTACINRIRQESIPAVMGNHDRAVSAGTQFRFGGQAAAGVEYTMTQLDSDAIEWLGGRPTTRTLLDNRVKIVHGHPDDPDRYTYPSEFTQSMLDTEEVLITGHTHVQGHKIFNDGIVMNPGSVGQPRDGDPDAAFSVVDLDDWSVKQQRVSYDIDAVVESVRKTTLPDQIGERLYDGR
jgi:Predicted phosphoesterase